MQFKCLRVGCESCPHKKLCDNSPYYGETDEKVLIVPFNDLPQDTRIKMIYYMEDFRKRGMEQVLNLLKDDIGVNQKKKILSWMQDISDSLSREYKVIHND